MYKKIATLMLFSALLIPVGCARTNVQQADLDSQIETQLDNQNLKDVDADLKENGRIELTGTVNDASQKALAEKTARSVNGVKQVDNLIKVEFEESADARDRDFDYENKDDNKGVDGDIDNDKDYDITNVSEKKTGVNDAWISFKTKLALYADKRVSGNDINVETKDGVVNLIGKVPTNEAKNAALQVAKQVKGVKNVNDQIQIVPESQREVVDDKDDNITKNVNDALDKDTAIKDINFGVKTNNGVVTLTGNVDNMGQVEKAIHAIRNVQGVKAVNANAVEIKNKGVDEHKDKQAGKTKEEPKAKGAY